MLMTKKARPIVLEELTQEEKMKYEIAEELGLLDKVMTEGWKSLSSKETGRIGGILARKRRRERKVQEK
ncbi:MAG: small, acid-soluble spore protein, alpha/beta type [Dorea sp.]